MAKRKTGVIELSAICSECKGNIEINWLVDLEAMHDCDRGCCCGDCYSYYSGGYEIIVLKDCPHCGVYLRKRLVDTY